MKLIQEDIKQIIKLASLKEPNFSRIAAVYGLSRNEVTEIMRSQLSSLQFHFWSKRINRSEDTENFFVRLINMWSTPA